MRRLEQLGDVIWNAATAPTCQSVYTHVCVAYASSSDTFVAWPRAKSKVVEKIILDTAVNDDDSLKMVTKWMKRLGEIIEFYNATKDIVFSEEEEEKEEEKEQDPEQEQEKKKEEKEQEKGTDDPFDGVDEETMRLLAKISATRVQCTCSKVGSLGPK